MLFFDGENYNILKAYYSNDMINFKLFIFINFIININKKYKILLY